MQTTLDRLRARGSVVIAADADGYRLSWWPKGQKGNPLCGRGESGPTLEPLIAALEEATRPPSRDFEDARYYRVRQAEHDAAALERFWMRHYDRDDRQRERRAREAEARRIQRRVEVARREQERVRRILAG